MLHLSMKIIVLSMREDHLAKNCGENCVNVVIFLRILKLVYCRLTVFHAL